MPSTDSAHITPNRTSDTYTLCVWMTVASRGGSPPIYTYIYILSNREEQGNVAGIIALAAEVRRLGGGAAPQIVMNSFELCHQTVQIVDLNTCLR